MTDYSDLRRKAEAATPGPWEVCDTYRIKSLDGIRPTVAESDFAWGANRNGANAAFIAAAHPAAVLSLLDERDALAAQVATMREALGLIQQDAWTHPADYETDRRMRLERIAGRVRAATEAQS